MATAAHLTDHVLPDLPVQQWELAVPKRLRKILHRDPDLQGATPRLFLRAMESCLRAHSSGSSPAARLAAVAFIHRHRYLGAPAYDRLPEIPAAAPTVWTWPHPVTPGG